MGFGLQVSEIILVDSHHGLVVLQVLLHLLVRGVGHEEGVSGRRRLRWAVHLGGRGRDSGDPFERSGGDTPAPRGGGR